MSRPVRILDFDIENRPLSYLGEGYTTSEITAIAACFVGEQKQIRCWLLGRDKPEWMLEEFRAMYNSADIVTGHYIRMHDLPIINGSMLELGREPLEDKLTCDTKLDLISKGSTVSGSQENLCKMLKLRLPKVHMNNALWREANRLTEEGLALTYKRATGDVLQHMALRKALVKRNLLSPPKIWRA